MVESPSPERKFQSSLFDWILRVLIFVAFLFFGASKFKSNADAPWVVLFSQIGFGQWFRYFTGAIELLGAFLVIFPRTVTEGFTLLACTMAGAMLIDAFVLHRLADAFFPFAVLSGLIALWMHRRRV